MKKKYVVFRPVLSVFLTIILTMGLVSTAFAASWRTGNIPDYGRNTSAITVTLSNTKKDAAVKVHGYSSAGKEKDYRFHVTMRDKNGRWIWEGDINTGNHGKKLTLGKDHSVYKLYLRFVSDPTRNQNAWNPRDDYSFPAYWGVECTKNCSVK